MCIENKYLNEICNLYKNFSQTVSVAIGGSSSADTSDSMSDIDVYVFIQDEIPLDERLKVTKEYSTNYEVGGEYFGSGDEFFVDNLKKQLDVMFWNINWFEQSFNNVWINHNSSNGYTTCFLYTLSNLKIIYDTDNWLNNLQNMLKQQYPNELKENIIKRNLMLIKDKPFASYYEQIEKAINRNDIISINHRISAFLASYFDIIFAINNLLHPGEKRLISYAKDNCKILPQDFEENLIKLLNQPNECTLTILENIVTNLKNII